METASRMNWPRLKARPRCQNEERPPLWGPFSFWKGWDQERNLVQQNASAFWTHEVRPEGARIAIRRFESILPPLPTLFAAPSRGPYSFSLRRLIRLTGSRPSDSREAAIQ
jgi:hypothetical protein